MQTDELRVPWLRRGIGATPAQGGCIMQILDWIERGEWTDKPPSVHPFIRRVAICVNDYTADDVERLRLLDLGPRMLGTSTDTLSPMMQRRVEVALSRYFVGRWDAIKPPTYEDLVGALDVFDLVLGRRLTPAAPIDYSRIVDEAGAPTVAQAEQRWVQYANPTPTAVASKPKPTVKSKLLALVGA